MALNSESLKIIGRWSRWEHYVYIRPQTSAFAFPEKKARQYWVVRVECRGIGIGAGFSYHEAEGFDLDEIILKLSKVVPARKIAPEAAGKRKLARQGWLAPKLQPVPAAPKKKKAKK